MLSGKELPAHLYLILSYKFYRAAAASPARFHRLLQDLVWIKTVSPCFHQTFNQEQSRRFENTHRSTPRFFFGPREIDSKYRDNAGYCW
jgi:hypothetical protein